MKLGEPLYAIVCPDGTVAGNGDGYCLFGSVAAANDELEISGSYLRRLTCCEDLRVVPVVLAEGGEPSTPPAEKQRETR